MGTGNSIGEYRPGKPSLEIKDDFDIRFSINRDSFYKTVVPFGILDFNGKTENAFFAFNYQLMQNNVDQLQLTILDEKGNCIFSEINLPEIVITVERESLLVDELKENTPIKNDFNFKPFWDFFSVLKKFQLPIPDYTKVGSYTILWDGFDNEGVFDSTRFNNKKLTAVLKAQKDDIIKELKIEFHTSYSEVDWVDVKIDRNNKRIDTTLRVNLTDGGEEGLRTITHTESETTISGEKNPFSGYSVNLSPWDKIPREILDLYNEEPIKTRTKTFEELKQLVLDGLKKHWSRSFNNGLKVGNSIKISNNSYEFNLYPISATSSSLNGISLLFNTNGKWSRSGNPGFLAKLSYNVGYIEYSNGWGYQSEANENIEFKETAAHEIGHPIIFAYGGMIYSWEHKGSSYLFPQDTKPTPDNDKSKIIFENIIHRYTLETAGEYYPVTGEIDLMKYYNSKDPSGKKITSPDNSRTVVAEKDVIGLIWLTKLKIR